MKSTLLLLLSALLLASCARQPKTIVQPDEQARRRVVELEQQLQLQRKTTDRWEFYTGSLGVACLVFLVLGTALGAKTRHDASLQSHL
jgi:hypothetical protein